MVTDVYYFERLTAFLQNSKKSQAHHNCFLIKCRLPNQKDHLGLNPPNYTKYTPKKISATIFIS